MYYPMTYGCHNFKKQKHPEQLFSLILEYFFVNLKHTIWKKTFGLNMDIW